MNNFDFKKYFLFNKYKMPQHIRTNMSNRIRHNKPKDSSMEKFMSYMPQSIRKYITNQETSGLTIGLVIFAIIALIIFVLIYLGVIPNPIQSLTAPKQNLQYFFF